MAVAVWVFLLLLLAVAMMMGWPAAFAMLLMALIGAAIAFALYIGGQDAPATA